MYRFARLSTVIVLLASSFLLLGAGRGRTAAPDRYGIDWEAVKRDWPRMSGIERDFWERIFGDEMQDTIVPFEDPDAARADFPSELCQAATLPAGTEHELPIVTANTTIDRLDLLDLSGSGACAAGGTQFSGTGIGADLVYKIRVDRACDLAVTVRTGVPGPPDSGEELADEWDVALYVIAEEIAPPPTDPDDPIFVPCQNPAEACVGVSDGGGIGLPESVPFTAFPADEYYIVVDGFLGSSGVFEIDIVETTSTGCKVTRMTLREFLALP